MITSHDFNSFNILPHQLMLHIIACTFSDEEKCSLESVLDYQHVNKNFSAILSDESNFKYIIDSMPTEFNIDLIQTLRRRKITTEEGRYRAGLALLFLKYLYEHVKPFPNDEFIINNFSDYYTALKYIQDNYTDYPMPMYLAGIVGFYISKRLLTLNPLNTNLINNGFIIYKISTQCIIRADVLEHPLAKIFYADMASQLQRARVKIDHLITNDFPKMPCIDLPDLITIIAENLSVDLSQFNDETQTLLFVTWRKLIIENYDNARDLFSFAYKNNKLVQLTEFFYRCYQVNHFHRHFLAYNPLFTKIDKKENLLYLLEKFSIDSLVNLHQDFLVKQPHPDSILLSTLLTMSREELFNFRNLISDTLALPQTENSGWRICFHEAYRNAVDDGTLKTVSTQQMKMILNYLILVHNAGSIDSILDRDANILEYIFHHDSDHLHEIALSVIKLANDFTRTQTFSYLYQKELLLSVFYRDANFLSTLKITESGDTIKIATIIVDTYTEIVAPQLPAQNDLKVYDYIFNNPTLFQEVSNTLRQKLENYTLNV